ncbi:tetratricopeptide repeat protein [Flavobacterium sp.]|uniref:tetratricopeptide repeat-containing sensor histidine kinase n=1 Tax=Flavobacterium sp. TaxID=239 RepID=UPI00262582A9|nr:tetratricopeptide repeat protein [Flavobacterium sp.]
MSKLLYSLLFFIIISSSFAQEKTIDSLQNVLNNYTKRDTVRVNLLNSLATKIYITDTEKALTILKDSETLSSELNYKKGKAYSLLFSGNTLLNKAEYTNALHYFQKSLDLYKELKDKKGIANSSFNFGRSNFFLGEYDKALKYFKETISICEETGDLNRTTKTLAAMGVIYSKQGDYDESLKCHKKALQINEKLNNKNGIASDLLAIGNLLKHQGKFTLALENYNKSLEIKEKLGDQVGIATNLENIGNLYVSLDKDKEALEYYKRSLAINEKLKNPKSILASLINIGTVYMNHNGEAKAMELFKKALVISTEIKDKNSISNCLANIGTVELLNKKYDVALDYFERAININKQLNLKRDLTYCYLKIGKVYQAKKEYDKALNHANQAMEIAKELNHIEFQRDLSLLISELNYENKNYKLAYENRLIHKKLNDSIFNIENFDSISQIKYKYAYKDTLNSANKSVNTLKKAVKTIDTKLEASQQRTKWLIVVLLGLFVLLGFVITLLKIRKVKMQNQQLLLEQKLLITQMNPHFIFNSIDNIQGLIYNNQDKDAISYLTKFSKLTRQILENSNENYITLEEEVEMIENYIALQQLLYNGKFDYTISVEKSIETESILLPPMLTQPFIENAIKHGLSSTSDKGVITINFYLKDTKLFFEVADNGKGFDQNKNTTNHKSLAMTITKERLVYYTKNQNFEMKTNNIMDKNMNIVGAQVVFEIPYIYEK